MGEDLEKMKHMSHPVKIVVGGVEFVTSEVTLKVVKTGLLARMIDNTILRKDGRMYIDREALHFRYVLNYLRNGGRLNEKTLPVEERFLYEIREEAKFYQLPELVETVNTRLINKR